MPVHFPSESGLPAETTHGRSNGRAPDSVRLGFPLRDANTGVSQDITGLAAAVQLRLRVAILADGHQGLQALQRCSGLLNRRARGSTVATHHFGGGTRIEKFMRSLACPARPIKLLPSASSSVSNAPVAQCIERRASNAEVAGESPAGSANFIYDMRFAIDAFFRVSPTTRDTPLRTERLGVEIPHAAPICPRSPTQRRRT